MGHFDQEFTISGKDAFLQLYSALLVLYCSTIFYKTSFLVRADIELSENVYFKVNLGKIFFINKLRSDVPLFYFF